MRVLVPVLANVEVVGNGRLATDSRSSYLVAGQHPADSDAFLDQAAKLPGSWWPDYVEWLAARSGELRPAPRKLGNRAHRALAKAPGSYVHAS